MPAPTSLAPPPRACRRAALAFLLLAALGAGGCHDLAAPLGLDAAPDRPRPMIVSTPHTFVRLAAETDIAAVQCGIRSDGPVECWGGMQTSAWPVHEPSSGAFTQLAVAHSPVLGSTSSGGGGNFLVAIPAVRGCALQTDGAARCWRYYGDPTMGPSEDIEFRPAVGRFVQVGVADAYRCGLRADGVVECQGGRPRTGLGEPLDYGNAPPERAPSAPGERYAQFSMSDEHTCALRTDGVAECWGRNPNGEAPPQRSAAPGHVFLQVTAGDSYSCGLRNDGAVECWGWGAQGAAPAERLAKDGRFVQVSAGHHTCALRTDGVVECWGQNYAGQAPPERAAPAGDRFVQVTVVGGASTCGLRARGAVECWGATEEGTPPVRTASGVWTRRERPVATFEAPTSATYGTPFTLALMAPYVPGAPGENRFTFRFDCGDGAGYLEPSTTPSASCPVSNIGERTVRGQVIDPAGDLTEYTARLAVQRLRQTVDLAYVAPRTVYVGETYVFSAVATSGLPGTVLVTAASAPHCAVLGSGATRPVAFTAEGQCTVVAHQGGTEFVEPAFPHSVAFTVVRRPQTISLTPPPASGIAGASLTLSARGGESGNPVTFASLTPAVCTTGGPAGATLALTAAGTCGVRATQAGNATFADAAPVTAVVAVQTPAQATVLLRNATVAAGHRTVAVLLDAALGSLARGQTAAACSQLTGYINEVRARRGGPIPAATADAWIAEARRIQKALGC